MICRSTASRARWWPVSHASGWLLVFFVFVEVGVGVEVWAQLEVEVRLKVRTSWSATTSLLASQAT